MKKQIVLITSLLFTVMLVLSACAPATAPTPEVVVQTQVVNVEVPAPTLAPKDDVSVRTNWLWYGSHSPLFLGKELGLYDENNINLEIRQGNGSGNTVKLVANGDSDFGYVSGAALINQVAQGAPVIAVATIDAAGTDAVLCNPDSGIKTIKDLEGKNIMTTAGAGVNVFWPVVVKTAGLDETKIKLTNVAEAALVPSYLQGLAPCILGGLDDKPAQIEANGGKPPVAFPYSDYGVYQPGYVIAANTKMVQDNPELVRRFVAATCAAYKAGLEDPEAAVNAMAKVMGGAAMDEVAIKQALQVLAVTNSILISPNNTDKKLCFNTEKDWASALELLKTYSELQTDKTPDQFFTNEFIP